MNRTPQVLAFQTLGESWIAYMQAVCSTGKEIIDDREPIIECGPITLSIGSVAKDDDVIKKLGDLNVVEMYTRKMFSMEIIKELNSTYGDRIFANNGVNQFDWLLNRLRGKWWTKAASISLLKPNDPGPRIPCLTQLQFLIRNDALELHSVFRSQNVFRSYGNFIGLNEIQNRMARELSIQCGAIHSYCVSPHIYKSDLAQAKSHVDQYWKS